MQQLQENRISKKNRPGPARGLGWLLAKASGSLPARGTGRRDQGGRAARGPERPCARTRIRTAVRHVDRDGRARAQESGRPCGTWTGTAVRHMDRDGQAKLGRRIIAVDPITMVGRTGKPWISDLAFVKAAKRTTKDYGCSVLLVTHPTKDTLEPTLQNLAGGAAYQRFVDVVITLQSHEPKQSKVSTPCGTADMEHNRTVRVEKARNGRGTGCRLAFDFEPGSLKLKEIGIITKKKKGEDE